MAPCKELTLLGKRLTYDDALFHQLLRKREQYGMVSRTDINEVFLTVIADFVHDAAQQMPDKIDELSDMVTNDVVPELTEQLEAGGWRLDG